MSLSNGTHFEVRLGSSPLQNGHCPAPLGKLKYKRRRVSVVRDFPPGIERAPSQSTLRPVVEAVCTRIHDNSVNGQTSSALKGNDSIQSSGTEAELSAKLVSDSLVQEEMGRGQNILVSIGEKLVLSSDQINGCAVTRPVSDQVDGLETRNLESIGLPLPELVPCETSDALKNSNEMPMLESGEAPPLCMPLPKDEISDIIDMSKHTHQVDFTSKKEEMNLAHQQQSCSLVSGFVSGLCEAVKRNYPRRRKASAVRDFPPFTGPNAPRFSEKQIKKLLLAENKNLDMQKSGIEDMTTAGYEKEMRLDIQDGSSDPVKLIKSEEQDAKEKSKESVCGDDAYGLGSRTEGSRENMVKDIEVYQRSQSLGKEVSGLSGSANQSQDDSETLESEKMVVQHLKAVSRKAEQPISSRKVNKHVVARSQSKPAKRKDYSSGKVSGLTSGERNSLPSRKPSQDMQLVVWDKEEAHKHGAKSKDLHGAQRPRKLNVSLPPSHPVGSSGANKDATGIRNKVKETLRLFQGVCRKLLREQEANAQAGRNATKRVDYQASRILKDKGELVNTGKQIIGCVPGVEVGDEFQYRVELNMIGLHKQVQGGIDYLNEKGLLLATSIVASGGYDDDLDNSDVLVYTGQGGNVMNGGKGNVMNGGKEPEDQKLERGNLALANSKDAKNPVRVIRGDSKASDSSEAKGRTYIYDGLYEVEDFWQEMGPHGKLVFKFKLCRIPGQPELSWKVAKKSKKSKFREGLCKLDISEGKERIPICAVNTIDGEKAPSFIYTVGMIYPDWYHHVPPEGCGCTTKCSESSDCSCVIKNGGEIPYNHDGAIVQATSVVYECGPSCKCPPSCYNRVSQRGIKFQLEVFKTDSRGWGVRSLHSIPSGSFICEYAGELLEEKEAERRTGNDEYLFDIGNSYSNNTLWDGVSNLMHDGHSSSYPVVEDGGEFTIDAARCGNIGRFINHSCSPNLYAQNVLYDHEDTKIPHVMFFAMDNIPPLQELTYHYNYMIDQVRDSNGNIKKKNCYCGSSECTGRLY